MMLKTWPYGTHRQGVVQDINCVIYGSGGKRRLATVIIDDQNESHIMVGFDDEPPLQIGDTGTLTFKEGGRTGGYWKFEKQK